MRAIQFMGSVSQPIAATDQLVVYPPFLGGYLVNVYNTYASTFTGIIKKNEPKMMVPMQ